MSEEEPTSEDYGRGTGGSTDVWNHGNGTRNRGTEGLDKGTYTTSLGPVRSVGSTLRRGLPQLTGKRTGGSRRKWVVVTGKGATRYL